MKIVFREFVREWRRGATVQTGISANQIVRDHVPSPAASASRKKQKVAQSARQSFSGLSPMYNSQAPASKSHSSSAAKRGQANGLNGKKQKSVSSLLIIVARYFSFGYIFI